MADLCIFIRSLSYLMRVKWAEGDGKNGGVHVGLEAVARSGKMW